MTSDTFYNTNPICNIYRKYPTNLKATSKAKETIITTPSNTYQGMILKNHNWELTGNCVIPENIIHTPLPPTTFPPTHSHTHKKKEPQKLFGFPLLHTPTENLILISSTVFFKNTSAFVPPPSPSNFCWPSLEMGYGHFSRTAQYSTEW